MEGEPAAGRGQALATVRGASAAGSRTGVWGEEESADSASGKGLMVRQPALWRFFGFPWSNRSMPQVCTFEMSILLS